jgi:hypothetical protein
MGSLWARGRVMRLYLDSCPLKCDASCLSQIFAGSLHIKRFTKLRPLTYAALFGKSLRANK